MSRTRSLMIASIVAFSDRARTVQIGQRPSFIASSSRTSTMSVACGSLTDPAPGGAARTRRDRERVRGADRSGRVARGRTRHRRAGAGRCRGAADPIERLERVAFGDGHLGRSADRPARPASHVGGEELPGDPAPAPGGCDPDGERCSSGPVPSGRCDSAAPTTVVPATAIVARSPSSSPAATSRAPSTGIGRRDDAAAPASGPPTSPRRPPRRSTSRRRRRRHDRDPTLPRGPVGERIPPAAVARHPEQPRHERAGGRAPRSRPNAVSAAVCDASSEPRRSGASSNRSGQRRLPVAGRPRPPSARATRRASPSGTSRCAPASQTRAHDRGTTRYAS